MTNTASFRYTDERVIGLLDSTAREMSVNVRTLAGRGASTWCNQLDNDRR
jgi:hypothetical protein